MIVFQNKCRLFWLWEESTPFIVFSELSCLETVLTCFAVWQKGGELRERQRSLHGSVHPCLQYHEKILFTRLNRALDIVLLGPSLTLLKSLKSLRFNSMKAGSGQNCLALCRCKRCRNSASCLCWAASFRVLEITLQRAAATLLLLQTLWSTKWD